MQIKQPQAAAGAAWKPSKTEREAMAKAYLADPGWRGGRFPDDPMENQVWVAAAGPAAGNLGQLAYTSNVSNQSRATYSNVGETLAKTSK